MKKSIKQVITKIIHKNPNKKIKQPKPNHSGFTTTQNSYTPSKNNFSDKDDN